MGGGDIRGAVYNGRGDIAAVTMNASILLRCSILVALAASSLPSLAQDLVKDGGFETAVGAPHTTTHYSPGQTIDGGNWFVDTPSSGRFYSLVVDRAPGLVISGTTSLYLSGAAVQQTLTTVAGRSYRISLAVWGFNDPFAVSFGGSSTTLIAPYIDRSDPPSPIARYSFVQYATNDSTILRFDCPANMELDEVSVTPAPVPEPSAFAAVALGAVALVRRRRKA